MTTIRRIVSITRSCEEEFRLCAERGRQGSKKWPGKLFPSVVDFKTALIVLHQTLQSALTRLSKNKDFNIRKQAQGKELDIDFDLDK